MELRPGWCLTAIHIVTGLLGRSFRRAITGICLITLVIEGFIFLPKSDAGAHEACQRINSGSVLERLIHQAVFVQVCLEELVGLGILVRIAGGSENSTEVRQDLFMVVGWRLLEVDEGSC